MTSVAGDDYLSQVSIPPAARQRDAGAKMLGQEADGSSYASCVREDLS